MTTPTPSSADTVTEDRAHTTEGTITFTRIPDPPNTARRGGGIRRRVLWGALILAVILAVVFALVTLSSRTVAVERPVSAPMLDRALADADFIRGLKEGGGARVRVAAGDPLPLQVKVSGEDACALAGGTVILQSDPPACDVDVPLIGGVR